MRPIVLEYQPDLPGLEPGKALDVVFFALSPVEDDLPRIVQAREGLRCDLGLTGRGIDPPMLHLSLHLVGGYDGLPGDVVRRAVQAGALVRAAPLDLVFDQAMTFRRDRIDHAYVLCTVESPALDGLYEVLGNALRSVGFRRVASRFRPHMTLLYDKRVVAAHPIALLPWTARHLVLVHSVRGLGHSRHNHLARWRLDGDASAVAAFSPRPVAPHRRDGASSLRFVFALPPEER
jgi:2'-5' RNA ligase